MTIPVYHNDPDYKLEYDPQTNNERFNRKGIGPQEYIDIDYDSTIDVLSCIIVDPNGSDSNDGLLPSTPKATITASANACSGARPYVMAISGTWAEDLSGINNDYFTGLKARTSTKPQYTLRELGYTPSDANTRYIAKTGSDSNDGTAASPKLTIGGANNTLSGSVLNMIIQDSETYDEAPFSLSGTGLYAALGETPTVTIADDNSTWTATESTTIFEAGTTAYCALAVRPDDKVVVCYEDHADGEKGKFIIYNADMTVAVATTQFDNGTVTAIACAARSDNGFVEAHCDTDTKGQFQQHNSDGALVGEVTFTTANIKYTAMGMFSDDSFVIAYSDADDGGKGKFCIYDSSRKVVKAITEFTAETVLDTEISVLSNDNFIIMYKRGGSTRFIMYDSGGTEIKADTLLWLSPTMGDAISICKLSNDNFVMVGYSTDGMKFVIYDSSGTAITPVTSTGYVGDYLSVCSLGNDNFVISYVNIPDEGMYLIYDKDGNKIKDATQYEAGAASYCSAGASSTDALYIAYVDGGDSSKGKVYKNTIGTLYWTGITVSAAATINGITFDGEDQQYLARLFNGTAKLTSRWCEFKNVTNPWDTDNAWAVYTTGELDAQKNSVHDNGCGFYIQNNKATIKNNLFYRNSTNYACHIKGTAASSGDIIDEHNTYFDNYAGLQLEDNGGSNEIVKNDIFNRNSVYGIKAETAMTFTSSINTDTNSNATAGTGSLATNPLFVNQGDLDEDDTDLQLRMLSLGDYADSPAYQLGDDTSPDRDAGAYDAIIIGEATTWSSVTVAKPPTGIDITYEMVGDEHKRAKDGTPQSKLDAIVEVVSIKHDGCTNAIFETLLDVVNCGDPTIRWYPDPTTYPTTYFTYKLVYENIKGSSKLYKLTRTGRQDAEITFARAYE